MPKYTLACDASGVHQEFDTDADSKDDAEKTLRQRAAQAGWEQKDCAMK